MSTPKQSPHVPDEERVLAYWEKHDIFGRSVAERPKEDPYIFYDGPPFATGLPHYGHILASTMKDAMPRFWTMQGKRVDRVWGWDCHGLPIENIVEKEFSLGSKKDIELFGVNKFNEACHNTVLTYAEEWKKVIRRLGRWVDMENSYQTMDASFMESVWWVFKMLWEKGLIYEGYKPMHICPRCETALSNFEVNQNYQNVKDISVFATFPLTSGKHAGAKMVAWTTTPWTLPGNVLLAIGPSIRYVKVFTEGGELIFGAEAWQRLRANKEFLKDLSIEEGVLEIEANELVGSTYEPLFPFFKDHKNAFRVVYGDFVVTGEGTGIVHIAPGFGEDDMNLGQKEEVEPIMHVGMNGHFVAAVEDGLEAEGCSVKGKPVKAKGDTQSIDIEIIKALAKQGKLLAKQKLEHSYPLCWRCDTPLLNYATSSWFVRVTEIKDRLVALNKDITWVPDSMKEGRFGNWLEGARDWAISRSRYWGTPIPIWRAEDGSVLCIGSIQELESLSGASVTDIHKHLVDAVTIEHEGKTYTRVPDVLDCWFESGAMPYAGAHYPFEKADEFKTVFPADFIAEGQDQTRGWFYTLHVLAVALFDSPAFKNVIVNGIVLAEDGKKMSKRLQNYPDPTAILETYGADAVRFYLLSSPVVKAENLRLGEAGIDEVSKKYILIARNVLSFYQLYHVHDDGRTPSAAHALDAWILARLEETKEQVTEGMLGYDFVQSSRPLQSFVTDLSTWYVRRSRDRLKEEGNDQKEALATLRTCLETFALLTAPFTPFLAELIYQELHNRFEDAAFFPSVHLAAWPLLNEKKKQEGIIAHMAAARRFVSKALELRAEAGIPVRQVLGSLTITTEKTDIPEDIVKVIAEEVNVQHVTFIEGDEQLHLDFTLTPELLREGLSREMIRRVNALRKEIGLTIEDRIVLGVVSSDAEIEETLSTYESDITQGTLAIRITRSLEGMEHTRMFRAKEHDAEIGIQKI